MKSLDNIIPALLEKSRQGKIAWSEEGDFFKVDLKGHTISLRKIDDTIKVALHDGWGDIADELWSSEQDVKYGDVDELYTLARRKARNVDRAISDIEEVLAQL